MFKKIVLSIVLAATAIGAAACDICGSGVGSNYIGLLPEFNKKIIGLRYRHNTLTTHIGAGGQSSYLTTHETYQTAELWGAWSIGSRFRVMGSVPVNFNHKKNSEASNRRDGLGDVSLQGYYKMFDKRSSLGKNLLSQSLWMGAGVKLPTGKYEAPSKEPGVNDPNIFQLGTGSTDFSVNAMYDIRLMDFGVNTTLNYKLNTENSEGYRYGNKFSANLQAYYKFRIKDNLTVAPNAGALLEAAERDHDNGFRTDVSGGHSICGTMGFEVSFKRIAIGASAYHPLSQDLANGSVKAGDRAMLHVSLLF